MDEDRAEIVTTADTAVDRTAELRTALAQFRKQMGPLLALAETKLTNAEALEQIEKMLRKLPPGEILGRAVDETRDQFEALVAELRREYMLAFGRIEAEYIRGARQGQKILRETGDGWRIGPLCLQMRRDQARAQVLYNHETLIPWTTITAADDLAKLEQRGHDLLKARALPEELLNTLFWDAYEHARSRREQTRITHPELVPILDFYAEVRIALVRQELLGQKPDRKLTHIEFPRWAFSYNLDRYRNLSAAKPETRRLGFQSGSQQEVQRGQGVTMNGLEATQDYRTICYIIAVRRPS